MRTTTLLPIALSLTLAGCAGNGSDHPIRFDIPANPYAFNSDRDGNQEIYLGSLTGPEVQRVTNTPENESCGPVSPDGTKILYTTTKDGNAEVYVMNVNGTNPVNLTNDPGSDSDPRWSADGAKIVFTSDRSGRRTICTMNADGSNFVSLTNPNTYDSNPCLSPDGTKIVYTGVPDGPFYPATWIMNADGTNRQQLTPGPQSYALFPVFSPDGTQIAYYSSGQSGLSLWRMSADGQSNTQLTTGGSSPFAAWSPDGTKIFYVFQPDNTVAQIYQIDSADGANPINLSQSPSGNFNPNPFPNLP